jgi:uncharacterized protein (DUF302 family)
MHYFSKVVTMNFADAVDATRRALNYHQLAILAEIDLRDAMKSHLALDFRPYHVLCTCSLPLARQALEADENVGSMLLCNVVVQQHDDRRIEISTVDPDATIGTINHVDLVKISSELRTLVQHVIDDVERFAKGRHDLRQGAAVGQKAIDVND